MKFLVSKSQHASAPPSSRRSKHLPPLTMRNKASKTTFDIASSAHEKIRKREREIVSTDFFPTTQCQVVPYNLSNSFLTNMAASFSTLYCSRPDEAVSTARCCMSSATVRCGQAAGLHGLVVAGSRGWVGGSVGMS